MRADWALLGADPSRAMEATSAAQPVDDDQDIELSPDEWRAWQVFLAVRSNWRIVAGWGAAHYEGIDYSSLESAIRLMGIGRRHWPDVFSMVRVMEDEARNWINKQ